MENIDVLKFYSPKKILEYMIKIDLMDMLGWEWVYQCVEADKKFFPDRKAYMGSRKEIRFKFAVEVANNPKHALEMD